MQLFSGSSAEFIESTAHNEITERLRKAFFDHYRYNPSPSEVRSWQNSLGKIKEVVAEGGLLEHGVLLEYQLPLTSKRLDFMITGHDGKGRPNAAVVELKQWDRCAEAVGANEVATWIGQSQREVLHPSVQVGQYHMYLSEMNSAFYAQTPVTLNSCVYLHNWTVRKDDPLVSGKFASVVGKHPLFGAAQFREIKGFLVERLRGGEGLQILRRIQDADLRPSKKLMEHVAEVIKGKKEYFLLDEQLVAFDRIIAQATQGLKQRPKTVILIAGGPGTGKSVIALNVMAELLRRGINTHYATGSRAFTQTLQSVVGTRGSFQFKYFNSYMAAEPDSIDVIVSDEAHRIRKTSNSRFTPRSVKSDIPQVEELIRAARLPVFLIDDLQVVRPGEVGSSQYIREAATKMGCQIVEYALEAQFRCAGSDAFVNWVNNTLGIVRTANTIWDFGEQFEFRIMKSPQEVEKAIRRRASNGAKARITAGFCWEWSDPRSDGTLVDDVVIGEFKRPWNARPEAKRLAKGIPKAPLWANETGGIDQIGCVYTAQGFEFDYVGVIFGNDLVYDFGKGDWEGRKENSQDSEVVRRGGDNFTDLVKNAYRVLFTRGMKGCYVCFTDKETENFVRSRTESSADSKFS